MNKKEREEIALESPPVAEILKKNLSSVPSPRSVGHSDPILPSQIQEQVEIRHHRLSRSVSPGMHKPKQKTSESQLSPIDSFPSPPPLIASLSLYLGIDFGFSGVSRLDPANWIGRFPCQGCFPRGSFGRGCSSGSRVGNCRPGPRSSADFLPL